MGVVHSPLSPDRGRDTIAWAEGAGRSGATAGRSTSTSRSACSAREFVFATGSSALRRARGARRRAGALHRAAEHRLSHGAHRRGDGAATVSTHGVNEYDIAAGVALIRAAGGVVLDGQGKT